MELFLETPALGSRRLTGAYEFSNIIRSLENTLTMQTKNRSSQPIAIAGEMSHESIGDLCAGCSLVGPQNRKGKIPLRFVSAARDR
jgi:hypothetical protein